MLAYGPDSQTSLLNAAGIPRPTSHHLIIAMAFSVALCLAGLALWQRYRLTPDRDVVQKAYATLCRRTGRAARPRRLTEGPAEYADAVIDLRPDLGAQVRELFTMYIQLRYEAPAGPRLLDQFVDAVKRFRPPIRGPVPAPGSAAAGPARTG